MKEQFVTYEIALKLKELGFDEPCFGYYTPMKHWMISTNPKYNTVPHFIGPNWCTEDMKMRFMYVPNNFGDRNSTIKNSGFTKAVYNIAAPLWQQVIDWFRDKHHTNIEINRFPNISKWGFVVTDMTIIPKQQTRQENINMSLKVADVRRFDEYFECREQAILKAIKTMI